MLGEHAVAQAIRWIGETDSPRVRIRAGTHVGLSRTFRPFGVPLQAFFVSLGAVALAEIGDKTQLLALMLAAKFRRPWPICAGIVAAALVSEAAAAFIGAWLAQWMTPTVQRWLIGLSFLAVAVWAVLPEKPDADDAAPRAGHGVFIATVLAFTVAELGDRTQIATAVLGAHYQPAWQVVAGGTLGLVITNVPAVWLGSRFAAKVPLRATRIVAGLVFAAIGIWVLVH